MALKPCRDCKQASALYGSTRCERCLKIYNEKRKVYLSAYRKKWRAAHPTYMKDWREKNK